MQQQIAELTSKQLSAVDALAAGSSDQEAAAAAGVNRSTVFRWRSYNPRFRAELNARRADLWGASLNRLRSLLPSALARLEKEIIKDDGDWKAAAKLLEIAGAASQAPVPSDLPTIPRDVLDQDLAHRRKAMMNGVVNLGIGDGSYGGPSLEERREQLLREYGELGAFEEG